MRHINRKSIKTLILPRAHSFTSFFSNIILHTCFKNYHLKHQFIKEVLSVKLAIHEVTCPATCNHMLRGQEVRMYGMIAAALHSQRTRNIQRQVFNFKFRFETWLPMTSCGYMCHCVWQPTMQSWQHTSPTTMHSATHTTD